MNYSTKRDRIPSEYLSDIHIKNFNINKSNKNLLRRNLALVAAGIIGVTAFFTYKAKAQEKNTIENRNAIVAYYGEESNEAYALRYLDLAVELNELNLDKINSDKETKELFNISEELSTPAYIDSKIKEYKAMSESSNMDFKDDDYYKHTIMYLKKQKELLQNYIDTKLYPLIYTDLVTSLKEYTAEEYNLDIPENITFDYVYEKADNSNNVIMHYSQAYSNYKCAVTNKKIVDGVCQMINMQNTTNYETTDKERLDTYIYTLIMSKNFKTEVTEKDLYNENSEEKLKGK